METVGYSIEAPGHISPTLVLDEQRARHNIARMAAKAVAAKVAFRPHFKTHQSAAVGEWFREAGVEAITVSSMRMARYFADHGWANITVAFPVNLRELDAIDALAGRVDLGLLVDSDEAVAVLRAGLTTRQARIWIKVDAGYGRAGLNWKRPERILSLAAKIRESSRLAFAGILTHSGHSYYQPDSEGVLHIHAESLARMALVKEALAAGGIDECLVSVGDTPTCNLASAFPGVDEIRPGNFVFFDLMQEGNGACRAEDMALALACPVVSSYEERNQVILHGGAVHLSKEFLDAGDGEQIFGYLARGANEKSLGLPDTRAPLVSLSQEHGIVQLRAERLNEARIGNLVLVFPVHSCLTANLHREYHTLGGERLERLS